MAKRRRKAQKPVHPRLPTAKPILALFLLLGVVAAWAGTMICLLPMNIADHHRHYWGYRGTFSDRIIDMLVDRALSTLLEMVFGKPVSSLQFLLSLPFFILAVCLVRYAIKTYRKDHLSKQVAVVENTK